MEPRHEAPGHRRRGLHRLGRRPPRHPRHRLDGRQRRQADLRRQPRIAGRGRRQQPPPPLQGRHLRPRGDRRGLPRGPARRRAASGGREPRRPLDRRRGALHRDQCRRHLHPARGGARLLAHARRRRPRALPLPAHLDRRGVRLAGPDRQVQRDHALRSPTRPTPPARPPPTIWCAPGTTPTACRRSPPTAPTTTGPIISPRS